MPTSDQFRIAMLTAQYLEAFEQHNPDAMARIWEQAGHDPELFQALEELHDGLLEEQEEAERAQIASTVTQAVQQHLPSAEIVREVEGPLTMADVAEELFRFPPRLSAEAHAVNERLRSARLVLPIDLPLPGLIAWAEPQVGKAPTEYWEAFRKVALKLNLRRASDTEFQLAARKTIDRRPKEGS